LCIETFLDPSSLSNFIQITDFIFTIVILESYSAFGLLKLLLRHFVC